MVDGVILSFCTKKFAEVADEHERLRHARQHLGEWRQVQ